MPRSPAAATAACIREYHRELGQLRSQGVDNELSLRRPFESLLADTAGLHKWRYVAEASAKAGGHLVRPDGTVYDANNFPRGWWESKDPKDDLEREIERKIGRDYPLSNIIFENTRRAVLYQDRAQQFTADLGDPRELEELLFRFYAHEEPAIRDFERAVEEFGARVPELARGLAAKIAEAHERNRGFQQAYARFFDLCRRSLNPNIARAAVDEMLVQHLLTERLFRTVFNYPEFARHNAIAAEVECVIDELVRQSFSRSEYLKALDPFYGAIENAARTIATFSEKQQFLNGIYERFFRGYSVKVADTHGIVYTPPQIVEYMCGAVEETLQREFGLSLSSPGVVILDPCTGTGNFIVHLMRRISGRDLPRIYKEQLFANEVMLMPYYIASLNIEHEYMERTGEYEEFKGLCFVDTLDIAEDRQGALFGEANTERAESERKAPVTVIIGNPPYNVGQLNENDNNKNRKYKKVDEHIQDTYAKDSKATLKNKLSDAYVKFFRWATDRLEGRDGIVCFVSNNSFADQIAFDGMRKHLMQDFTHIDHIDLHGNVRKNPKLSGTTHNVFGIQVGVGITLAVRCNGEERLRYHRVPEFWRKEEKLAWLAQAKPEWKWLQPDPQHTWLVPAHADQYASYASIAEVFTLHSLGAASNRDEWVYDFEERCLSAKVKKFIKNYCYEVFRYAHEDAKPDSVDDFVNNSADFLKWTDRLKHSLVAGETVTYDRELLRCALYRPFTREFLYFDPLLVHRRYRQHEAFPTARTEERNRTIAMTGIASERPFMAILADRICDLHLVGAGCGTQTFPFYTYFPDGTHRRENITDAALEKFRAHYATPSISKWDIFHYIYAVLHHPAYRERFAENLKRELPRIPFAPDFTGFANAGRELARLHVDYEKLEEWPLQWIEDPGRPLSYQVEKMRLSKDKTSIEINPSLTLAGIPPETFDYRLGNRSALEWVIDQYRVTEDERSGIHSDPNREDDPRYIVRLVGQVVRVSVETARIVRCLPPVFV